jgi:hypothetical protein
MREHPDHYDAELLLRLYDLRREAKLREAREWFMRDFQAASNEELEKRFLDYPEESPLFRMVLSYWDMAASIVNNGLINEEFFFENTGEFWFIWMKVKHLAPQVREAWKYPFVWKNLETLAEKFEKWRDRKAPGSLDALRARRLKLGSGSASSSAAKDS